MVARIKALHGYSHDGSFDRAPIIRKCARTGEFDVLNPPYVACRILGTHWKESSLVDELKRRREVDHEGKTGRGVPAIIGNR